MEKLRPKEGETSAQKHRSESAAKFSSSLLYGLPGSFSNSLLSKQWVPLPFPACTVSFPQGTVFP